MKKYIATYTDKKTGTTWDLIVAGNNLKEAIQDARAAVKDLMKGCTFDGCRLER